MRFSAAFICGLICCIGGAVVADGKPRQVIGWVTYDNHPVHIASGPFRGQGFGDLTLNDIEELMPAYRLDRRQASAARMMRLLDGDAPFCASLLIKTPERAAKYLFSPPVHVSSGNHLIVRMEDAARARSTQGDDGIDVAKLPAAGFINLGKVRTRTLGPAIDPFAVEMKAGKRLVEVDNMTAVLSLLVRERVDHAFGTPEEVAYFERAAPEVYAGKLALFPVKGAEKTILGYFACARTPATEAFLADLGRLMDSFSGLPPWYAYYWQWAGPHAAPGDELIRGADREDRPAD
ncbi:transporter substrate-binding domain-containing protein [Pseudokordiimonas caeni]|uniref:transporter substrate-binding domain-containing protein n=1 Tax=Pseudokordiimonas caeni TaxID=2997908 RepID=UPI0028120AFB|nr:transporter substrate-binding domain-containing protein [Pseudokordiimonas caeni]